MFTSISKKILFIVVFVILWYRGKQYQSFCISIYGFGPSIISSFLPHILPPSLVLIFISLQAIYPSILPSSLLLFWITNLLLTNSKNHLLKDDIDESTHHLRGRPDIIFNGIKERHWIQSGYRRWHTTSRQYHHPMLLL